MKFRPLHDRVVVRRLDAEEKTTGGIIIPDTAKEKPMQGEVIAVGPGARNEQGYIVPQDVREGDRILFGKWSGTEVKIDGEELLIMKESDIMGILEGKPAGERHVHLGIEEADEGRLLDDAEGLRSESVYWLHIDLRPDTDARQQGRARTLQKPPGEMVEMQVAVVSRSPEILSFNDTLGTLIWAADGSVKPIRIGL